MKMGSKIFTILVSVFLLVVCGILWKIVAGERDRTVMSGIVNHTYSNPGSIKQIGDPFVLKAADGKYYCYPTSGFRAWSSDDLVHWEEEGAIYQRTERSWGVAKFWAPEVVEHKGRFYLYYTAERAQGGLRIGIAAGDSPKGPFVDVLGGPLFDFGYAAIDPHVLVDGDGRKYLYFSRDVSDNIVDEESKRRESHIYVVELQDDMVSVKGEPRLLIKPEQEWELRSGPSSFWNEGPEVFKRNGLYYLMYSGNFYGGRNYAVGYATSKSPLGPFIKYENNPVLSAESWDNQVSGPGHHSVAVSPDGRELFIIYHTHTDPEKGGGDRQVCIDRMGFREDGSIYVNGPTLTPQPMPSGSSMLRNIAPEARVTVSSEKESYRAAAVTDGEISIYERNEKYEWASRGEGKGAWIQLDWDARKKISYVFLYDSAKQERKLHSGTLIFSNGVSIPVDSFPSEPGSAAIVNFDEMEVQWVRFVVGRLAKGATEAGMSEIIVLGRE